MADFQYLRLSEMLAGTGRSVHQVRHDQKGGCPPLPPPQPMGMVKLYPKAEALAWRERYLQWLAAKSTPAQALPTKQLAKIIAALEAQITALKALAGVAQ